MEPDTLEDTQGYVACLGDRIEDLEVKVQELEDENASIKADIQRLYIGCEQLFRLLKEHGIDIPG